MKFMSWRLGDLEAHHYYLSEEKDPDLVEHNFEILRKMPLPMAGSALESAT